MVSEFVGEPNMESGQSKEAKEFVRGLANRLLSEVEKFYHQKGEQVVSIVDTLRQNDSIDGSFGRSFGTQNAIGLVEVEKLKKELQQLQDAPFDLSTMKYPCLTGPLRSLIRQGEPWQSDLDKVLKLKQEYEQYPR